MKSVWRFSTPSDEEKRLGKHPTQKPLALIARSLRATTDPNDLVFDPFSGSGSTIEADATTTTASGLRSRQQALFAKA